MTLALSSSKTEDGMASSLLTPSLIGADGGGTKVGPKLKLVGSSVTRNDSPNNSSLACVLGESIPRHLERTLKSFRSSKSILTILYS